MTYVPNTIEIPTHGVNLRHHGLGFGRRSKNRQWGRRKVERERRKKESEEEERERERVCPILHIELRRLN
jgi:hypothetical protein